MIIDCHTHAFSPKIATRAMDTLSTVGAIVPCYDGTPDGLLEAMAQKGVDVSWVLNIATRPQQQTVVNNWAAEINSDRLFAFGSVHPDAPDALEELERIATLGLKGIKLHPDYQNFFVDDPRCFPIYRKAAALGLIAVFHAGIDIGYPDVCHCTPQALRAALPHFDGAPVVAAHMGGYMEWLNVEKYLIGLPVYLDTAYCYGNLPIGWARRIMEAHGYERILFGSDAPWSDPANEQIFIRHLCQGDEAVSQAVFSGNALKLMGR